MRRFALLLLSLLPAMLFDDGRRDSTLSTGEGLIFNFNDMADISFLAPKILKWEGLFVDDPLDRGGATNMGVTIGTWRRVGYDKDGDGDIDVDDLRLLTKEDVVNRVLKPAYWDKWRADDIDNQSIADLLVDWVWGSGVWGIRYPQRVLGVRDDGVVGPVTLAAVNGYPDQRELFGRLWERRRLHFESIVVKDSSQGRFLRGWLNRLEDFKYSEQ
jgi:lysozyme family protein